jgi:Chaperone of endosialidase
MTQSFFGIDLRYSTDQAPFGARLAVGAKLRSHGGEAREARFNFHSTPGDDTWLQYRRDSSAMLYAGLPLDVNPSILPGPAYRVVVTPYGGVVLENGTLKFKTDESGGGGSLNVFEQDRTRTGFVVGLDIDAFMAPFANGMQPFVRIGAQVNFMPEIQGSGQSTLGFDYRHRQGPDTDAGVRVGAGVSLSDIRLKGDIVPIRRLDSGLGLYRYRYIWSDEIFVGVMAQEVAAIAPDAVVRGGDGYLRVDYARLGLRMQTWDEWTAAR